MGVGKDHLGKDRLGEERGKPNAKKWGRTHGVKLQAAVCKVRGEMERPEVSSRVVVVSGGVWCGARGGQGAVCRQNKLLGGESGHSGGQRAVGRWRAAGGL